jgi:hypothetical protein
MKPSTIASAALCVAGALALPAGANAQTSPPPAPPAAPAPAAAPSTAVSLPYGISMTGHVEVGTNINPDSPDNNVNFGQTFTDRDNSFRMNQAMLNIERDLDPKNADYQWGFKFTGMYGTDSRVTHFYNEFDRVTNSPYQWDIVELDLQAHLPTYGGGTDVKLGQYPTPLGAEVIDATGNTFFSHSYIFNYGLPFKHTGLLTTSHISDTFDLWLGIDTGVNDSIGAKGMVNNAFPKVLFGFGLNNLMGGNLTILALSHIGAETPLLVELPGGGPPVTPACSAPATSCNPNSDLREYFDLVSTYKINDSWTTVNEIDMIKDDFLRATGGGVAQYLTYTLNDQWSLGARVEAFADDKGAFVCSAQGSLDYTDAGRGLQPNTAYCSGSGPSAPAGSPSVSGDLVYGEVTLGANYKPSLTDLAYFTIRPEVRFDSVIGGNHAHPYDVGANGVGAKSSQVTLAIDAIVGF